MGRIKKLELSIAEKEALEKGYRNGDKHRFRERCQMILLKNQGLSAASIGKVFNCHQKSVYGWVNRYLSDGIGGLATREGSGRKPILHTEEHVARVREAVAAHRQRIGLALGQLEAEVGQRFSEKTLRRFLKKTVADINAYEKDPSVRLT